MSISAILTRGYGTWGSVNLVVTRGYGAGAAPIITKTGGDDAPPKHEIENYKKCLKRQEEMFAKQQEEKLSKIKQLREQIKEAFHPTPQVVSIVEEIPFEDIPEIPKAIKSEPQLRALIYELERELLAIAEEQIRIKRLMDEEAVIYLLLFPFGSIH